MKRLILLLAMVAVSQGVTAENVVLELPAGGKAGERASRDIPIKPGSCLSGNFRFDVSVSDPSAVQSYICYFRSGDGWYRTAFEPTDGRVEPDRTYRVELSTVDINRIEGSPVGWAKADLVRFAAYRSSGKPTKVTFGNLGFAPCSREAVFIRSASLSERDPDAPYLSLMRKSFSTLGIGSTLMDERDLSPETLKGAKVAVLAHSPRLSDATCAALEAFVAAGGRLFAAYSTPARISRLLGIENAGPAVHPGREGMSPLAGFAKGPSPLRGQPDFAPQPSWVCRRVRPVADAKVAAVWRTVDGKVSDIPALVTSSNGVYVSHVWLGGPEGDSLALFAAAVETLLPGTLDRLEKVRAALAERDVARRRELAAMPGKDGERRFIWCHSAWGMGNGYDWDASCRFMKENGFTDLLANLAWGGCAFYPSKVLPRAEGDRAGDALAECLSACRKHGIRFHVWKVCWNHGRHTPASFTEALAAEGRLARYRGGKGKDGKNWSCPSDPRNRQLEIDAMVELALEKGVDGIHFDYIRYTGTDTCFCDKCRERFERMIGRPVVRWPQDVSGRGPLAADWTRFRCGNIDTVVRTVAERVKAAKPEVEISAATFMGHGTTAESVAQDWVSWCRAGWLDFVCPMDYISNSDRYADCIQSQREALRGLRTRLYPGLAIECSQYHDVDPLVIAREILAVREAGLGGFSLFHLGRCAETFLPYLRMGPLK